MPTLTQNDVNTLRGILDRGDRAGFYYAYARMVQDVSPRTFDQVIIQAQITSYGGLWGGAAQLGNYHAQARAGVDQNGNSNYNVTLDEFSLEIAERLYQAIELSVGRGQTGIFNADEIQELDYSIWREKGIGHLFPGGIPGTVYYFAGIPGTGRNSGDSILFWEFRGQYIILCWHAKRLVWDGWQEL